MAKKALTKTDKIIQMVFLLALPLGAVTWITVPIAAAGKNLSFMLTEVLSVFVVLLIWSRLFSKKRELSVLLPTALERVFILLSALFFVYAALTTVWRFAAQGFSFAFLSYPRISFVLYAVFFLFCSDIFSAAQKRSALLVLVTFFNAVELFLFLTNGNLRQSVGMVNVNIYACGVVMSLPLLLHTFYFEERAAVRAIIGFDLFCVTLLIPLTGSRLGILLLAVAVVGTVGVHFRSASAARVLQSGLPILLAVVCIIGVCNLPQFTIARNSVLRATMLDRYFEIENEDLHFEEQEDGSVELVSTSDSMRMELWKQALETIREYPLLGTGKLTTSVFVSGRYIDQSAHNFLLEMLVCYGAVGTVLYLGALICMFFIVLKRCKGTAKGICTLILVLYGVFSFMQPTFVSYLLLIWFVLTLTAAASGKPKKKKN